MAKHSPPPGLQRLDGEVTAGTLPKLLQTLAAFAATGELVMVAEDGREVLVRFQGGRPTHARSGATVGREALLLAMETAGRLRFVASNPSDTEMITIEDSLENILMAALVRSRKGAPALDGLLPSDIPVLRQAEHQSSVILDALHIQLSSLIDGQHTINDLASLVQLHPKQVLQAVFDLKQAGLVGIARADAATYTLRLRERLKDRARERAAERLAPLLGLTFKQTEELLERRGKLFQPASLERIQRVASVFVQAGIEVELVMVADA
jgi:Mn-dependent DtxR family transcriptional regulator